MEDNHLWRRVAEDGDERAFGLLYDVHADRVFRHAARLAEDRRDAEDATATAFLELWRKRSSVRVVEGSPLPWLLATTTNALRNLSRSAARYRRLIEAIPREERAASAEDEAFGDEEARALLAPLSPLDRQLVTLVVLEGFSNEHAGLALGLSSGAARTRISRARAKLRDLTPQIVSDREELA